MFSDELADEEEIVAGDGAVSVAQRFLHAAERSVSGFRTEAPGRKLFRRQPNAKSANTRFKQIYR